MTRKISILLISVFIFTQGAFAQMDLIMYNMTDIVQSSHVNPSAKQGMKFHIGFPGLSSIHLHHQNTVFNPRHLLSFENDVATVRTDHFTDRLGDNNTIGFESSIELLTAGLRVKQNYFSLSVKDRASASIHLPKDLLRFPVTGNGRFDEIEDNTLDFTDLGVDADHYMEFAIGWQKEFKEKWSFGLRLKYLKGFENVRTQNNDVFWKTDPNTFDWTISGEMQLMTSGIYENVDSLDDNSLLEQGEIGDYYSSKKNSGFGVDLGATYDLNERIDLSFSLVDFGFIKWKTDNKNYVSSNGEFVFSGLDLTAELYGVDSTITDSLESVLDDLQDEFENSFGNEENTNSYSTSLRSRVYLGATYKVFQDSKFPGKVGFTAQGRIRNKKVHPSLSLSYNTQIKKWLSASVGYSMINKDYKNIGAGLRFQGGPFQWYITADNLTPLNLTKIEVVDSEGSNNITYPSFSENIQIHTGVNFTFGGGKKDSDGDGIPDKKDLCPDVPGTKEFDGCNDTDGDGISDLEDGCPEDAGPKELNGCPDTDGDTIIDKMDNCPELAGPVTNNGCPDRDMDGVLDNVDECPDVKGIAENNGCPWSDRDTDGIMDNEDECPDVPGPLSNKGCPTDDIDADGVTDALDKCPDVAGSPENEGCPYADSDSDGVTDNIDKCPHTYGSAENEGCPNVSDAEMATLNSTFKNVEFISNTSTITKDSYPSIDNLIKILKENPDWKMKISGHTDSIDTIEANLRLSKKRAQAVADLVIAKGISADRLRVIGYGESQPIESNMYHPGRQKNRRVELEFVFD